MVDSSTSVTGRPHFGQFGHHVSASEVSAVRLVEVSALWEGGARLTNEQLKVLVDEAQIRTVADLMGQSISEIEARIGGERNGHLQDQRGSILAFAAAVKAHALPALRSGRMPVTLGLLPELEPVRSEKVVSPMEPELEHQQVAIDNLPDRVQEMARTIADHVHAPTDGRRRPTVVSLTDVTAALGQIERDHEKGVGVAEVGTALGAFLVPEAQTQGGLLAEATLQNPGYQPPVSLLRLMEDEAGIQLVPYVAYRGRHEADVHDLWAVRTTHLDAQLSPGDSLVLTPLSALGRPKPDGQLEVSASGPFEAPAGVYRVALHRQGAVIGRGDVEIPLPDESVVDLSQLVGHELRFVDGPARILFEADDRHRVYRTQLEMGDVPKEGCFANHGPLLARATVMGTYSALAPGCYDKDISGQAGFGNTENPVRARFEVFEGGLCLFHVQVGDEVGPRIPLVGAGAWREAHYEWTEPVHGRRIKIDLTPSRKYMTVHAAVPSDTDWQRIYVDTRDRWILPDTQGED